MTIIKLLRYLPAIAEIVDFAEQQYSLAKEDDGKVTADELFDLILGVLMAISRRLFPQLPEEYQQRLEDALTSASVVRDKVAEGRAKVAEALDKADDAYAQVVGSIKG